MTNPEPTATELEATAAIARDLIRIDTTNWGEGKSRGETEAAHYVEDKLRGLGLEPQLFESEPDRVSVVARVPGRDRDKPALVVHGHLDVVPADPANWSVDPFGGVVKDGSLWGRGAVDMKNMDAMMLTSLSDVIAAQGAPERDLVIAYFADEEAGECSARTTSSSTTPRSSPGPVPPSARSAGTRSPSATVAPTCCRRARRR
ncbi:M20/M25/M40 family metallo-hydrolase [Sphingomonas sp. LR61]|uniref:M20/M25/M40 family metallo-hydrolase n=1 Tax=Sphingomonas sp. LR61 TaxID=3050234 RepID=UPI002FE2F02F